MALADDRADLRADCASCAGLCCVAPVFSASSDFALDKPAGSPCPHLRPDTRCGIHDRLRTSGFAGCVVFDCFGAGQHVVQLTHRGEDWRTSPETASRVFASFGTVRGLHELRWHLTEAVTLVSGPLGDEVARALGAATVLAAGGADELARTDLPELRAEVGELLARVSARARQGLGGPDLTRRDLSGRDLRTTALRGAALRGALLLGADLRGADLHAADLLGADLRGADVRGADLGGALFLTSPQLEAARGDGQTRCPDGLSTPPHWR